MLNLIIIIFSLCLGLISLINGLLHNFSLQTLILRTGIPCIGSFLILKTSIYLLNKIIRAKGQSRPEQREQDSKDFKPLKIQKIQTTRSSTQLNTGKKAVTGEE